MQFAFKDITIQKINNGYIISSYYNHEYIKNYFKDMTDVIRHLQTVYGEIEKTLEEIQKEKKEKEK